VVRTPEGKLVISGGFEHRSGLLVNSVDVTDLATGRFGANLNDFFPPALHPDVYPTAPGNIPHCLLTWGVFPMRYGLRVACVVQPLQHDQPPQLRRRPA
jgi:hypothetical protein